MVRSLIAGNTTLPLVTGPGSVELTFFEVIFEVGLRNTHLCAVQAAASTMRIADTLIAEMHGWIFLDLCGLVLGSTTVMLAMVVNMVDF